MLCARSFVAMTLPLLVEAVSWPSALVRAGWGNVHCQGNEPQSKRRTQRTNATQHVKNLLSLRSLRCAESAEAESLHFVGCEPVAPRKARSMSERDSGSQALRS